MTHLSQKVIALVDTRKQGLQTAFLFLFMKEKPRHCIKYFFINGSYWSIISVTVSLFLFYSVLPLYSLERTKANYLFDETKTKVNKKVIISNWLTDVIVINEDRTVFIADFQLVFSSWVMDHQFNMYAK